MNQYKEEANAIADVLESYFKSIYEGDVALLGKTFYADALLFGDVKGQPYFKTLEQYLYGVGNRQSPEDSGKPFKGEIVAIEITNSIAMAKVNVWMYEFKYVELLSFHKIDNRWVIVNKMIADVAE